MDILYDFAKRLPSLCDDTSLKVRIRAYWALGSLADVLRPSEINVNATQGNSLPADVLDEILRASVAGCSDHEKVLSHSFRALGRLASVLPAQFFQDSMGLVTQAVDGIISNLSSGAFKVNG